MLVPVRDQDQDRLADGLGYVGSRFAVAGGEGDLDAVGGTAGLRPDELPRTAIV